MNTPSLSFVRTNLRNSPYVPRVRHCVQEAWIVGSVARGEARPDSDLDIAVVIDPVRGKSALGFTEQYHAHWERLAMRNSLEAVTRWKPQWDGRIVDFQFYYSAAGAGGASDVLPETYDRLAILP